jgi:hypothetical protein
MRSSYLTVLCLTIFVTAASFAAPFSYKPVIGYVSDAKTALAVAEAVLIPIYGADNIGRERPFVVTLQGQTWIVTGTLPHGVVGDVAEIEINKDDGRILRVSHGQ